MSKANSSSIRIESRSKPNYFASADKTDIDSSDHYLVWFELGRNFGRSRKKARHILYKSQIDRLQDKETRTEYQVELGLHARKFFKTLDLHQERVDEEELVCRMASKREKW